MSRVQKLRLRVAKKKSYKRFTRSKAANVFFVSMLLLAGLFMVLPLIYSIVTSFKPLDELLAFPPKFFVTRPTLYNYTVLPSLLDNLQVPFSRYAFNSIFISVVITVGHVIVAGMAAFTLSNCKHKFISTVFWAVQIALLFNGYTLGIPQYLIFSKLGIIDTYWVYITRLAVHHRCLPDEAVYGRQCAPGFDGGRLAGRCRLLPHLLDAGYASG